MTPSVALATTPDLPEMDQDEPLVAAALEARGARVAELSWRDLEVDWGGFDAVVIRSTWDYTADLDGFLAWTRRVEAAGAVLCNDAATVAWNAHKRYLADLEGRGVPIVPTQWVDHGEEVDLATVASEGRWSGVVAKPAVGAGAEGLIVVPPGGDPATAQQEFALLTETGDTMVQPFLDSVCRTGELSVVVIDGRVSHAVRKRSRWSATCGPRSSSVPSTWPRWRTPRRHAWPSASWPRRRTIPSTHGWIS